MADKEGSRERRGRHAEDRRSEAGDHQGPQVHRRFKIRDGYPIGCMVTLRGPRMFEFLDRLVTMAPMPAFRDFRGISGKGFDGQGTTTLVSGNRSFSRKSRYDKIDALRV